MIKYNLNLSIVIPTFNRAEMLDYCLGEHIPLARANNIQIFVVDNASPDNTEDVVKKRMEEYPLIRYHRQEKNVGPDANFEHALKLPETDYVWLLGDSYLMPANGLDYLLSLMDSYPYKYDVFLFNIENEVKNCSLKDYVNKNLLLHDMFWLMTCMSCLVFSANLIKMANFERYRNTNFIQTGIIFEYISNKDFIISWNPNISVKRWVNFGCLKKITWQSNIFEIWFKNRINFIFSLPASYDLDIKLKLAQEVHIHSKVSISYLLAYRASGALNYKNYKKYKYIFPVTMPQWSFFIFLFSIIPRFIPKILRGLNNLFFK